MSNFSGWATARRSYALFFGAPREAVLAGAIWFLVLTAFGPLYFAALGALPYDSVDYTLMGWIYLIAQWLVYTLAFAATAIAWHRFVLLGRRPAFIQSLSLATVAYVGCLIAAFAFVWLSPFFAVSVFVAIPRSDMETMVIPLLLAFLLFAFALRFALKLPAIVVDDRRVTFASAWRTSRPLWPALVWGSILVYAPLFIVARLALALAYNFGNDVAATLMGIVYTALMLVGVLLFATFWSLTYQFVSGDKGVGDVFA